MQPCNHDDADIDHAYRRNKQGVRNPNVIASTHPPGVIGLVNFSGGRTDATASEGAGVLKEFLGEIGVLKREAAGKP
jgi:hypothetical protein